MARARDASRVPGEPLAPQTFALRADALLRYIARNGVLVGRRLRLRVVLGAIVRSYGRCVVALEIAGHNVLRDVGGPSAESDDGDCYGSHSGRCAGGRGRLPQLVIEHVRVREPRQEHFAL